MARDESRRLRKVPQTATAAKNTSPGMRAKRGMTAVKVENPS